MKKSVFGFGILIIASTLSSIAFPATYRCRLDRFGTAPYQMNSFSFDTESSSQNEQTFSSEGINVFCGGDNQLGEVTCTISNTSKTHMAYSRYPLDNLPYRISVGLQIVSKSASYEITCFAL